MKKILIALALAGFTWFSASAQKSLVTCAAPKGKVCTRSGGHIYCYKTRYAEDYAVCKDNFGYHVCCETPNATNSTHPPLQLAGFTDNDYTGYYDESVVLRSSTGGDEQAANNADMQQSMVAPQSQSYPVYSDQVCATGSGCSRDYIRACYGGNNVAQLNRAPYKGCPTPAYDGPAKNAARNINSNDPLNSMPPVTGRPE